MVTSRMTHILAIAIMLVFLDHVKASVTSYDAASIPTENIDSNGKGQNDYFEKQRSRSLSERLHVDPLPDGPMEKGDPKFAAPEQVHIALAVSASREQYAMTVAWTTWPETASHVLWGETEDTLSNIAEGNATWYSAQHPGRGDYTSGFLHSATLTGLSPSTKYFYSCGDKSLAMSSVRYFVTPPEIGQPSVTLGIVADLGQTEDSRATADAIDADPSLDILLLAGDLSYADCDQPRWDSFMRMIDPIASRLPWMVAPGNHEIESGSFKGKPFVAYEHRFRMPAIREPVQSYVCGRGGGLDGRALEATCGAGQGEDEADLAAFAEATRLRVVGGAIGEEDVGVTVRDVARRVREHAEVIGVTGAEAGIAAEAGEDEDEVVGQGCCSSEWSGTYDYGNSFYSFDVGPVHVVTLNPYTASGEDSEQHRWLKQDLEAVDREVTPWIVTMFHCPWYHSNTAHQGERQAETAMRVMEPLLYAHKVAVVVTGHVHAYERTHPVFQYKMTEDGPTHLVVGGAGNREGHAAQFYPAPEWSAFRNGDMFGSGRLAIKDHRKALWEWTSSSHDGPKVCDETWIVNPYSLSPLEGEPPLAGEVQMGEPSKVMEHPVHGLESRRTAGEAIRKTHLADRRAHFAL